MRWLMIPLIVAAAAAYGTTPAMAHTEPSAIAVPAGEPARITLGPTHGCGESPTVAVRTRVSVLDAVAEPVEGWAETTTPDGQGYVVLEWTGGLLPIDEVGTFPVAFTAPSEAGQLLLFPFIQECENGEELAWIDGNPASDYPAPRLLILPAGSDVATSIDEVPLDAPGRDRLEAIIDTTPSTTSPATTTPPTASVATPATATSGAPTETTVTADRSTTVVSTAEAAPAPSSTTVPGDEGDDSTVVPWILSGVTLVIVGVAAGVIARRRRKS